MQEGGRQRLFGTDGIRGVAGQFPLDAATVAIISGALVRNLTKELGRAPRIVIGRDYRLIDLVTRLSPALASRIVARAAARNGF